MPEFSVDYSIASDFTSGFSAGKLHRDIEGADFTSPTVSTYRHIERVGDVVKVIFDRADGGPLPAAQQTTLDNLVANHQPNPDAGKRAKAINVSAGTNVPIFSDDPNLLLVTASGVGTVRVRIPPPDKNITYYVKRMDDVSQVNVIVEVRQLAAQIDGRNGIPLGIFPASMILIPHENGYARV